MNHTPGPWPIEGLRPGDKDIVIPGPGVWVDYDDVNHEEAMANAKLIAAAPELLKALKELAGKTVDRFSEQIKWEPSFGKYLDAAFRAIEKATL